MMRNTNQPHVCPADRGLASSQPRCAARPLLWLLLSALHCFILSCWMLWQCGFTGCDLTQLFTGSVMLCLCVCVCVDLLCPLLWARRESVDPSICSHHTWKPVSVSYLTPHPLLRHNIMCPLSSSASSFWLFLSTSGLTGHRMFKVEILIVFCPSETLTYC